MGGVRQMIMIDYGVGDWVRQYDYVIIQSRFFDLAVCLPISHEFFQKGISILLYFKRFAFFNGGKRVCKKQEKQFKIGLISCKKRFWGWVGVTI